MSRDSGRYDAITQQWIDQQIRVDFAWGNIPLQPNTDRDEEAQLDPELDNHEIAVYGYQGFPAFITGAPYDDTVPNVAVPNVVGLSRSAAQAAISAAGLDYATTTTQTGANSGNDDKVKTQSPAAGTLVNVSSEAGDTTVSLVVYDNPAVIVPNVVDFDSVSAATTYLLSEGLTLGTVTTSTVGATTGNWGWVKSQNPAANTSVAPGTAVNLVSYQYVSSATTGSISGFTRNGGPMGWSLNGNQVVMFVTGRTDWPAIGSSVIVTGTSNTTFNQTWTVADAIPDNSYNTGGTALKLTASATFTGSTSSGGTWALPTPLIAATDAWWYSYMAGAFRFMNEADLPAEITGSAASAYKLVLTGGAYAGQYPLATGTDNGTFISVTLVSSPFGNNDVRGLGVNGGADTGLASIVAI